MYPCILPDHCNPSTFLSGRVFAEVTSFVPRQVQQGAVDWTPLPVILTLYIHVQLCVGACEKGGGLGGGDWGEVYWRVWEGEDIKQHSTMDASQHTQCILVQFFGHIISFLLCCISHCRACTSEPLPRYLAGNVSMACMYSTLVFCSPNYCYTNAMHHFTWYLTCWLKAGWVWQKGISDVCVYIYTYMDTGTHTHIYIYVQGIAEGCVQGIVDVHRMKDVQYPGILIMQELPLTRNFRFRWCSQLFVPRDSAAKFSSQVLQGIMTFSFKA